MPFGKITNDYRPLPGPDAGALPPSPQPVPGLPVETLCRITRQIVAEIILLTGDRTMLRRDRRRYLCHERQIAMYVCNVALGIPLGEIGRAFGRDRSTVGHACRLVEDRRDDAAFDDLVAMIERKAGAVFVGQDNGGADDHG